MVDEYVQPSSPSSSVAGVQLGMVRLLAPLGIDASNLWQHLLSHQLRRIPVAYSDSLPGCSRHACQFYATPSTDTVLQTGA